jgi:hypothetical protein
MNLPPLLLGATLVFWGWQTGLPSVGALMAVLFEGLRVVRLSWESSEDELNRLWNLVTVIFLAAAVFAFTTNEGPSAFSEMFGNPGLNTSRVAGESSQKTAASLVQWLPMIFFLFVMAVALGRQNRVKLRVLSLIARKDRGDGEVPPLGNREIHVGWVFFSICLVSSSINSRTDGSFFTGLCVLLGWALWTQRSRRFVFPLWAVALGTACLVAYWGQDRLGDLRVLMESFTPQWGWRVSGSRTNPDQDRTSIGQIGRFRGSGRIVIRLEPTEGSMPPSLLRTASYRFYRSPVWSAGSGREERDILSSYDTVVAEPHTSTWVLRHGYGDQVFRMATYLEGGMDLLPLPLGVTTLRDLPVFSLKTNGLGVVLAEGPGIVLFEVEAGGGGSMDSPPGVVDLMVPDRESEAVELCVAGLKTRQGDTARLVREVTRFFQDDFEYSLWQGRWFGRDDNPTPLARFLIQDRRGHCEYFATATVLMLRQLDIPARYAVGWAVDETSGNGYVVRERHAHAWCLYYDVNDDQWHDLDTTPAIWAEEEKKRASIFEFLSDGWQRIKFEFMKWRWGQSNFRDYVWWIIGPLLVFLLYRLLRRKTGEKKKGKPAGHDRLPARLGLDSEFYLLEKKLAELSFVRGPGETQAQLVERAVRDVRVSDLREVMFAMLRAHYRLRFDPMGLTPEEREALGLRVRDALAQLAEPPTAKA